MNCVIRSEQLTDYKNIRQLNKEAFFNIEKPDDFNEWQLIDDLRKNDAYISDLSIVAIIDGNLIGHILFTPLKVINDDKTYDSLALAPMAVVPNYQNKGIGHQLIEAGIKKAKELGYGSIIALGHPSFYTKFGFELASQWHIGIDNDFDCAYLFGLELVDGALSNVQGTIQYAKEFYNKDGELI